MTFGHRLLRLLWDRERPRSALRDLAFGLIYVPPILLLPLTLGFFVEPFWMFRDLESFELFAMFFAGPWAVAAFLFYWASRTDRSVDNQP